MDDQSWNNQRTAEELLHSLGHLLSRVTEPETLDGNFLNQVRCLTREIAGIMQDQALFQAEIESLRQEVDTLRRENSEIQFRHSAREIKFKEEIAALQSDRDNWLRILLEEIHGSDKPPEEPGDDFEALPLVIRNGQQEYLGVADKRNTFSLSEFLKLVEATAGSGKAITVRFKREKPFWTLYVIILNQADSSKHEHVLKMRRRLTPSGNDVVELVKMAIDGRIVPKECLLALFRRIKKEKFI